jgi:hypothetical protein
MSTEESPHTEHWQELIDRLLDDEELGEDEAAELDTALGQSPGRVSQLAEQALMQALLRQVAVGLWGDRIQADQTLAATDSASRAETEKAGPTVVNKARLIHSGRSRWLTMLTSACLGLAFLGVWLWSRHSDAWASPAGVVARVLPSYQVPVDRRYSVQVDLNAGVLRRGARPPAADGSTLWVRNREFVQQYGGPDRTLAWGRDARGAVWFCLEGRTAAVFEADELPEPLRELCELRSLDLDTLLQSLLRDYDLQFVSGVPPHDQIQARPRPASEPTRHGVVELEIDRSSRQVRRITLERLHRDRPIAWTTFALEETATQPDSLYDCQTHLVPGGKLLDRGTRRGRRSELLREFLQQIRQPLTERRENE